MQSLTIHSFVCLSVAIPTDHSFDDSDFLYGIYIDIPPQKMHFK